MDGSGYLRRAIAVISIGCSMIAAEVTPVQEAVFQAVWQEVHANYYDPEFGGKDWEAIGDRYRSRLEYVDDSAAFDELLAEMLRELGESHFSIASPAYNQLMPERWQGGDAGMDLSMVGNRAIVHRVAHGGTADLAGLKPGFELVAVGETTASNLRNQIVSSGVFKNTVPYFTLVALGNRLFGFQGETIELRAKRSRFAKPRSYALELQEYEGRMSARLGNLAESPMTLESKVLSSNVHYLRFDLWFPSLMEEIREEIRNIDEGAPGLIIDLRGNPGGIGLMATGLAGMLVDQEYEMGRMQLRQGHLNFNVYPQEGAFLGPLAVLVDGSSISTSEIFAADMQETGRGRLFGSRTAGAALPSIFKKLPNGYYLQMAIADYVTSKGSRIEKSGVVPDTVAVLSPTRLTKGEDSVIEAASKWVLRQD